MQKLIIVLALFLATSGCALAAQLPKGVKGVMQKTYPEINFRFDGVIILPDNTIYLPIIPAKIINPEEIQILSTIPEGKSL